MNLQNIFIILTVASLSTIKASPQSLHELMTPQEFEDLFGVTNDNNLPEYEIASVHRRQLRRVQRAEDVLEMSFAAFGNQFELSLPTNDVIQAPNMTIVMKDKNGERVIENENSTARHYIGGNDTTLAAMSTWRNEERTVGVVISPTQTFEVRSLPNRLQKLFNSNDNGIPHLIKRSTPYVDFENSDVQRVNFTPKERSARNERRRLKGFRRKNQRRRNSISREKTIELAVFLDEEAYKIFAPLFQHNEDEIRQVILGFVNQLQAIFYHNSLGEKIHLTVKYIEILKTQPANLPHYNGDRYPLLTSFCKYQKQLNPNHGMSEKNWDMALYLTGLDLFVMENGKRNSVTMGLTAIGGICIPDHSCVVGEFGATSKDGRPFPTAGWAATYVMAHEMGHNLGMLHDGYGNNCPKDGYIMSSSRGFRAETVWSSCSAATVQKLSASCLDDSPRIPPPKLDHSRYQLLPGQKWTAYDQCRLYIRDSEAVVDAQSLTEICSTLKCRSRKRIGYYLAGPALDGTYCGNKKWCKSGSCVNWSGPEPRILEGGWGQWTSNGCTSGCIAKSKGAITMTRECNNPKPENSEYCQGPNIKVELCDDNKMCNKRLNVTEYASEKCKQFSEIVTDVTGNGIQVSYNPGKPWQSCAIFCRSVYGTWYTPRYDLNDLQVETYFPDGTWCHNDGNQDYFCQQRTCVATSTITVNTDQYMLEKSGSESQLDVLMRQIFTYPDNVTASDQFENEQEVNDYIVL